MLTGDLVRTRTTKQRVIPLYLDRSDERWLETAESLLLLFREGTGMTRGQIESEIDELFGGGGKATQVYRGLAKVLEDRAEFEVVSDVPPEELREKVFTRGRRLSPEHASRPGCRRHRAVFRRDEIIAAVAGELNMDARGRRDRALRRPARREPSAPVRGHHRPAADRPLQRRAGAGRLAAFGLVRVEVRRERPPRYRQLFRRLKFHRLLYTCRRKHERRLCLSHRRAA